MEARPLLRGRGHGYVLLAGVLVPLVTLGLYMLAVLAGLRLIEQGSTPAGVLVLLIVPAAGLISVIAVHRAGHRGRCRYRREVYWFLAWPGFLLGALAGF